LYRFTQIIATTCLSISNKQKIIFNYLVETETVIFLNHIAFSVILQLIE